MRIPVWDPGIFLTLDPGSGMEKHGSGPDPQHCFLCYGTGWVLSREKSYLKVLTNEKRGGVKEVAFDMSCFKLFTLKFSNKSVQSSSCERCKTAQRILFLLLANNNYFPIMP
jgi:hypothetical protein